MAPPKIRFLLIHLVGIAKRCRDSLVCGSYDQRWIGLERKEGSQTEGSSLEDLGLS